MTIAVRVILGAVIGVAAGLAMYKFVGCRTGACPLYANPYLPAILWGLVGAFLGASR